VLAVFLLFALSAKGGPNVNAGQTWRDYAGCLRQSDTLWFSFLYCLTFGGFVGFTSFLTTFFYEQYGVTKVSAGDFATIAVVAGSFLRPVGGWLSDRVGGYRLLVVLLVVVAITIAATASLPPLRMTAALFFIAVGCLGIGNGAVFQLVPQRFIHSLGLVTGIVGAAGGLGGFFLSSMLGASRDATGTYGRGLQLLAVIFFAGALVLLHVGSLWAARWDRQAIQQSGVFSYRRVLQDWLG
jgi:NNP family nitrate/nitrite transporter-like MFS transporter